MINGNVEPYFKLKKKANKGDITLPVGEFVLRSHESRKSNQRRFVQKFFEVPYKDSERTDIISKRSICLLSSFFIEKDATCGNGDMKKDQAIETNTAEKMSNFKRKRKSSEAVMVNLKATKREM